jgi:hypothetical protein
LRTECTVNPYSEGNELDNNVAHVCRLLRQARVKDLVKETEECRAQLNDLKRSEANSDADLQCSEAKLALYQNAAPEQQSLHRIVVIAVRFEHLLRSARKRGDIPVLDADTNVAG